MARPRLRRPRPGKLALPQLLPNLITVGAICAGITAIRLAYEGRHGEAVALIVLAAVLDGLDGRLARLLKAESPIGAELDSLADFLNFGVAPGLLIHAWGLQGTDRFGWIAVLVYAICCVLRLARFNVEARSVVPSGGRGGFVGVPAPAGALLVLVPVYLGGVLPGQSSVPEALVAAWMILTGLLMISRIPTPSLKSATVRADQSRYLIVLAVALTAALVTWPWTTLLLASIGYLSIVGLGGWRHFRKQEQDK